MSPFITEKALLGSLSQKIAELTGINLSELSITRPLAEYGLDSVHAVGLAGELEEWLGIPIEPTIVWDYPSIEAMAHYLMKRQAV